MANTYLTRTQVAGNRSTFTQSFWFKLSNTGDQTFISTFNDSSNYNYCYLDSSSGELRLQWKKSGSVVAQKNTTRKFRDFSAWYHIVYAIDTTQASGGDRIKLYVNGVLETDFSSNTAPGQITTEVNDNGTTQYIGSVDGSQQFLNGSMSYVAQIDGTAELPTVFGETDATTGEWKIKTTITPSVALGNNGFLILKDGNTVTDSSTNSNNFAVAGGTLTKTEDCPDNVFATNNPLDNYFYSSAFNNGNTTIVSSSSTGKYSYGTTTFGIPDGKKIYCEVKMVAVSSGSLQARVGLISYPTTSATISVGSTTYTYGYNTDSGNITTGNAGSSYGTAFALGDIMGIAIDTVNNKLYFSKNGTWQNSGVPTSGSTGTGAVSIADLGTANSTNSGNYFLGFSDEGNNAGATLSWNFGNGYFGTTAVSSAGTTASTPGIFEYDVPTGYQPLSTKGLNA